MPSRSSSQPPHRLLREEDWRQQLRRCLNDTALPVDVRAAGALIALFGIAIARVVELTADNISQRDDASYLVVDQHPVLLPPRWAELLHTAAQAQAPSALGRSLPPGGGCFLAASTQAGTSPPARSAVGSWSTTSKPAPPATPPCSLWPLTCPPPSLPTCSACTSAPPLAG